MGMHSHDRWKIDVSQKNSALYHGCRNETCKVATVGYAQVINS